MKDANVGRTRQPTATWNHPSAIQCSRVLKSRQSAPVMLQSVATIPELTNPEIANQGQRQ